MGKIWIGGTELKKVWVGSSEIAKIWKGSELLWSNTGAGTGGGNTGGGTGGDNNTENAIDFISATASTNGVNFMQITNSHTTRSIKVYFSYNVSQADQAINSSETVSAGTTIPWGNYNSMSNFEITGAEFV